MLRVFFAVGVVAALIGSASAAEGSVAVGSPGQIDAPKGGPTQVAAAPGDLVRFEGIGAIVPQPGHGVIAAFLTTQGSSVDMRVWTEVDGRVFTQTAFPMFAGGGGGGGPGECNDSYEPASLGFGKWTSPFLWYFHSNSTPSGNNVGNVETDLKTAVINVLHERNVCGRPDSVTATTSSYGGRLQQGTNIDSTGHCLTPDGTSMAGFGTLPSGILAGTCIWTNGATPDESDMRLDSSAAWSTDEGSGCNSSYNVDDVATHERGHTFDMADVTDSNHTDLTMYAGAWFCDTSTETLGLGDMLRLEAQN